MASMLLSLGKKVTMVTDNRALEMNQAIINEAVRTGKMSVSTPTKYYSSTIKPLEFNLVFCAILHIGVLKAAIPLVTFEGSSPDSARHFLCHDGDPSKPRLAELLHVCNNED